MGMTIDIEKVMSNFIKECEEEIKLKYPSSIIISLNELIILDTVSEYYEKLMSCGCAFDIVNAEDNTTFIGLRDECVYVKVPKFSEITFICGAEDTTYELSGKNAALFMKGLLNTVVNTFCVRVPHQPITLRVKYKEIDTEVKEEYYNSNIKLAEKYRHLKKMQDVFDSNSEITNEDRDVIKERIRKSNNEISMLSRYGVKFSNTNIIEEYHKYISSSSGDDHIKKFLENLIITVPKSSRYMLQNQEMASDYMISFTRDTLQRIFGPVNLNIMVRDEHWDSKQYNEMDELSGFLDKLIGI